MTGFLTAESCLPTETDSGGEDYVAPTRLPSPPDDIESVIDAPDQRLPRFGQYPEVPFDIDEDIRRSVLQSRVHRIEGNYYTGRAHGADIVIDADTSYFNASNLVADDPRLDKLLGSETMELQLDYVKNGLGREPYYRVTGKANNLLNGIYMHGITIGNVMSIASLRNYNK